MKAPLTRLWRWCKGGGVALALGVLVLVCVAGVAYLVWVAVWLLGAVVASWLGHHPPQAVTPDDTIHLGVTVANPDWAVWAILPIVTVLVVATFTGALLDEGFDRLRTWWGYLRGRGGDER